MDRDCQSFLLDHRYPIHSLDGWLERLPNEENGIPGYAFAASLETINGTSRTYSMTLSLYPTLYVTYVTLILQKSSNPPQSFFPIVIHRIHSLPSLLLIPPCPLPKLNKRLIRTQQRPLKCISPIYTQPGTRDFHPSFHIPTIPV